MSLLQVREALESWLESAACARRSRNAWLEAAPATRIASALLHLGRLDEARERGRVALELARRAHDAGEISLACAHLASLEGVTGAFAESEHYARASLESRDRAGNAWAGVAALSARAAAAAHRGDFSEARAALDALATPERGKPGALVEFIAASYGEALAARGEREVDPIRVANLVAALRSARLDPYLVGALCALVEACDGLDAAELAVTPEVMLRHAFEHGVAFSAGWACLVPRLLARCAALGRRWDEADDWLERAIELARASGARVELALSLADRARTSERRGVRDLTRSLGDLDEAIRSFGALGMRPALREALALRRSLAPRA